MSHYKKIYSIVGLCLIFAAVISFHIRQADAANPYFTTTQSMFPFVNGQSTIGTTSPETFGERRYKTLFVQDIDMTGSLTSTSTATTTYFGGIKARGFDGLWYTGQQINLGNGTATTTIAGGGQLTITASDVTATTTLNSNFRARNIEATNALIGDFSLFDAGDATFGGTVTASNFIATSTSVASTFPLASSTSISSTDSAYFATTQGSVGVGTTSPSKKFSVNGTLIANGNITAQDDIFAIENAPQIQMIERDQTSPNGIFRFLVNNRQLSIQNDELSLETFTLDGATNRIGISTTTPGAKLSVGGDILGNIIYGASFNATSTTATSTFSGGVSTAGLSSSNGLTITGGSIRTSSGALDLFGGSSGNILLNAQGGNVGIGTTSPYRKLSVQDQSVSSVMAVDGGGSALINFSKNNVYKGSFGYADTGATGFGFYNSSDSVNVLIDNNGNVGIGDTTPDFPFEIENATASMQLNSTTGTNVAYVNFENDSVGGVFRVGAEGSAGAQLMSGTSAYAGVINVQGAYPLQFGTGNAVQMTINSSGNVGIGTTSPWRTFSVTGTAAMSGLTTQSGSGNVLCVLAGGEVVQDDSPSTACSGASTREVKHDILTVNSKQSLQDIMQMRPVSFVYNKEYKPHDQTIHYGFIKEEIEQIDPLLVEGDGLKYGEFVIKAISAIQEQQKQIDELRAEIEKLKKQRK